MIPLNTFKDYSEKDNQELAKRAKEFIETFIEAKNILDKSVTNKLKVTSDDNSIWIDPSIKNEFFSKKNKKMPIHLIFDIYERWFDQFYRLTIINEKRLHKRKLHSHIREIETICASFQEILKMATKD